MMGEGTTHNFVICGMYSISSVLEFMVLVLGVVNVSIELDLCVVRLIHPGSGSRPIPMFKRKNYESVACKLQAISGSSTKTRK